MARGSVAPMRADVATKTTARLVRCLTASAATLALVFGAAACSSDVDATSYSDENREAFLAACTETGEDQRMIRDVCECTFDQIEENLPFAEFVALEESLQLDALAPLPDSVAAFMAECFVAEVDL